MRGLWAVSYTHLDVYKRQVLVINGEVYTVEDRGGSGIENDIARVDIYVEDHQQALRLGRYWAEATFYRIGR